MYIYCSSPRCYRALAKEYIIDSVGNTEELYNVFSQLSASGTQYPFVVVVIAETPRVTRIVNQLLLYVLGMELVSFIIAEPTYTPKCTFPHNHLSFK